MKIQLDDFEFEWYDYVKGINGVKGISFKLDVDIEVCNELREVLKNRYHTFSEGTDEAFIVSLINHSYLYNLRNGQNKPDNYTFCIELEELTKEVDMNKMIEIQENKLGAGLVGYDFSIALKELLIEKKIITKEEWNTKVTKVEKETTEMLRELAKKEFEKVWKK